MKIFKDPSPLSLFVIFALFALLCRALFLHITFFDIDESQFAVYAQELLQDGKPYIASLDTKPIGIYLYFALCFWLGGSSMVFVHVMTSFVLAASATTTGLLAKRLSFSPGFLFISGLALIFYATFLAPKILATSINMILMLPLLASTLWYWKWIESAKTRYLLWSAGLAGVAFLFKYQAGILLVITTLHIFTMAPTTQKLRHVTLYATLMFLPALLLCLLYWQQGVIGEFWFYSFWGNTGYIVKGMPVQKFASRFFTQTGRLILPSLPLLFGFLYSWKSMKRFLPPQKGFAAFLGLCLVLHFLAICVGGRFYAHYFLQPLPFFILLSLTGWQHVFRDIHLKRGRMLLQIGLFCCLCFPVFKTISYWILERDHFLKTHNDNYPEIYKTIGHYLQNQTRPQDSIFVWGNATPIYYFAERRPASRFLWCEWLTGSMVTTQRNSWKGNLAETIAEHSWKNLMTDFAQNPPAYFLDTSPGNYHHYRRFPAKKYPILKTLLETDYTLETTLSGIAVYKRIDKVQR